MVTYHEGQAPQWVISDTHFGHDKMPRWFPWRVGGVETDLATHDRLLMRAWHNAGIGSDDIVLHLGDFCFGSRDYIGMVRSMLPGRHFLVLGNHDRSRTQMSTLGFEVICKAYVFRFNDKLIRCRHDPKLFTKEDLDADVFLHGHWHGDGHHSSDPITDGVREKMIDCGIDATRELAPRRIETTLLGRC